MRERVDAALKLATSVAIGAIAGAALLWQQLFGPLYVSGVATVIDGDNIAVAGQNVRLIGIDAPELPEREGKECRKLLSRPECFDRAAIGLHWRVGGEPVRCWITGSGALSPHGDWGRPLGVCFQGETELNAWMLRACHADLPDDPAHHVWRYHSLVAARDCHAQEPANGSLQVR